MNVLKFTKVLIAGAAICVNAQTVVKNIDFTKGAPDSGSGITIKGESIFTAEGYAQKGQGSRIAVDVGAPIPSGYAEVTILVKSNPTNTFVAKDGKGVFFACWQKQTNPGIYTHYSAGSKGYLRVRNPSDKSMFLEFKAYYQAFNHNEGETRFGAPTDWNQYIGKTVTLRLKWNGKMTYEGPLGPKTDGDPGVDSLQYFTLGSDDQYSAYVPSFVYQSVKIVSDGNFTPTAIQNKRELQSSFSLRQNSPSFQHLVAVNALGQKVLTLSKINKKQSNGIYFLDAANQNETKSQITILR